MATKRKKKNLEIEVLLKDLQSDLRNCGLSWASVLKEQIHKDKSINKNYRSNISVKKIYNVFNNVVKDREWKIFIYGQAKKLKTKLDRQFEKMTA